MRNLNLILLVGALCWPTFGHAQTSPNGTSYPYEVRSYAELPPGYGNTQSQAAQHVVATPSDQISYVQYSNSTPNVYEIILELPKEMPVSIPAIPFAEIDADISETASTIRLLPAETINHARLIEPLVPVPVAASLPDVHVKSTTYADAGTPKQMNAQVTQLQMAEAIPAPISYPFAEPIPQPIQLASASVPHSEPGPELILAPVPEVDETPRQVIIPAVAVAPSHPLPMPIPENQLQLSTSIASEIITDLPDNHSKNGQQVTTTLAENIPMPSSSAVIDASVIIASPYCETSRCPVIKYWDHGKCWFSGVWSSMYSWMTPTYYRGDFCSPCDTFDSSAGPLLWGETLWLRARRNDPFAQTSTSVGSNTTQESVEYGGSYEFAFRVGGGYVTENNLLFTAIYTHYDHEVANDSVVAGDTVTYVGPGQINGASGTEVHGRWELRYQTLDFMAGSIVSPSECVDLIFSGGVRIAWAEQDFRTRIEGNPDSHTERLRSDLRGAGPRMGAEGRIYLSSWLVLFGRSYISVLLSDREEDSDATTTTTTMMNTTTTFNTAQYHRREVLPVLESAIGLEANLCRGRVLLGSGYEFNHWFNLGDSQTPESNTNHSDLSLDGFYARVVFLW